VRVQGLGVRVYDLVFRGEGSGLSGTRGTVGFRV